MHKWHEFKRLFDTGRALTWWNSALVQGVQGSRSVYCKGVSRSAMSIEFFGSLEEASEQGPLKLLWWILCEVQVPHSTCQCFDSSAKGCLKLNDLLNSHCSHITLMFCTPNHALGCVLDCYCQVCLCSAANSIELKSLLLSMFYIFPSGFCVYCLST
jgi:hypothetical protein